MSITIEKIRKKISSIKDPKINFDFSNCIKNCDITINDNLVNLRFELGYHIEKTDQEKVSFLIKKALTTIGVSDVYIVINSKILAHTIKHGLKRIPEVRNIIAVASGKGGVGKSTISVNISLALALQDANVGILDADIYGPSIPTMLGISGKPESSDNRNMNPLLGYGIQTNSIGFLIDSDSPTIWRGPIATKALEQLVYRTNWYDLDYLIIDMPPGTGDIVLTLAQKIPVVGVVIVTTPQDISLIDTRRSVRMFQKIGIPILGIIENMSMHTCTNCGYMEYIFGEKGGLNMALQNNLPWLGNVPLVAEICKYSDLGYPIIISNNLSEISRIYSNISRKLAMNISMLPKDISSKIPSVVSI